MEVSGHFKFQPLNFREKYRGTHLIADWVCPRTGLDTVARRKKSFHCPYREWKPGLPTHSLVSIGY